MGIKEAEIEVSEFFMSPLGVAAQRYESSGSHGAADSDAWHESAMRQRRAVEQHNAARLTLGACSAEVQHVLRAVYAPRHALSSLVTAALALSIERTVIDPDTGKPELRLSMFGSLAGLAPTSPALRGAYVRASESGKRGAVRVPTQEVLMHWLETAIGAGDRKAVRAVRADCDRGRVEALTAYEAYRSARVAAAKAAKEEARKRFREQSAAFFDTLVEAAAQRNAERFDARLALAAAS
jgi:hypothetical protein